MDLMISEYYQNPEKRLHKLNPHTPDRFTLIRQKISTFLYKIMRLKAG